MRGRAPRLLPSLLALAALAGPAACARGPLAGASPLPERTSSERAPSASDPAPAPLPPAAEAGPRAPAPAPAVATRCPEGTAAVAEERARWCATPGGVWQGPRWVFDAEGRLRAYGHGEAGRTEGPWWQLHPGGGVASEAWFAGGELTGSYRQWDAEGRLRVEGRHDAQGRMHGRWRRFGPDGAPRTEWFMVHGRPEGPTRAWHPGGAPRMRGHREAGRPHGEWIWWDAAGAVRARCVYAAGTVVEGRCAEPPAP